MYVDYSFCNVIYTDKGHCRETGSREDRQTERATPLTAQPRNAFKRRQQKQQELIYQQRYRWTDRQTDRQSEHATPCGGCIDECKQMYANSTIMIHMSVMTVVTMRRLQRGGYDHSRLSSIARN